MNRAANAAFTQALFFATLIGAILNFIAFYPGILHHDAWAYFEHAHLRNFDNWQPPLLGFLWIPLQKIHYGPQPMFALFIVAYWSAFFLIARAFATESRTIGALTFATAFFPMALNFNGVLVKDIAMADCFLLAAGIGILVEFDVLRKKRGALVVAWTFLIAGAFMRANAFFALPPLLDLLGRAGSKFWAKIHWTIRALIVLGAATVFVPGHMFADRDIFRVKDIKPISQLQIFDIGGITYFSGNDGFREFFGPDFVKHNEYCYSPRFWDVYGWLRCPEVYENLKPQFGEPLTKMWLQAIADHPIDYLRHRLSHFNQFLQFLCTDCKAIVETGEQSNNQHAFTFNRGPLYRAIDSASEALSMSPLGPPYIWLLICLAWSLAALGLRNPSTRNATLVFTLSGALYALAFAVVGIASDYRYIFWTMLCALISTPVIAMRVLFRRDQPVPFRYVPVAMIIGIVVLRELAVHFWL